jgi:hypothetical protein
MFPIVIRLILWTMPEGVGRTRLVMFLCSF